MAAPLPQPRPQPAAGGHCIVVPRALLDAILAHALAEAPREACGILGGRDEGPTRRVEVAFPCRNVAADPRWAYRADPHDQLRAFLAIEEGGREVVGVYHSHPLGPPGPSAVDAAEAAYPGLSHVVVWLAPALGWGSWRWAPPAGFQLEPVEVLERAPEDDLSIPKGD